MHRGFWNPSEIADMSEWLSELTHAGYNISYVDAVMFCHQLEKHKKFVAASEAQIAVPFYALPTVPMFFRGCEEVSDIVRRALIREFRLDLSVNIRVVEKGRWTGYVCSNYRKCLETLLKSEDLTDDHVTSHHWVVVTVGIDELCIDPTYTQFTNDTKYDSGKSIYHAYRDCTELTTFEEEMRKRMASYSSRNLCRHNA